MTTTEEGPRNVIEALSRVMDELPGIGRDQHASQQQGGYAYRGIEQITRAAGPLFAKYGVVFVPEVLSHETRDLTVNNKPWTDTLLMVRYHVYGPGGQGTIETRREGATVTAEATEDKIIVGPVLGIGRDNSDKGANKALTQAFKYALIQTLCIGDAKDDVDAGSPEADEQSSQPREGTVTNEEVREFAARLEEVPETIAAAFKVWKADQGFPYPWPRAALEAMRGRLADLLIDANGLDSGEPEPRGAGDGDDGDAPGEARSEDAPEATSNGHAAAASPDADGGGSDHPDSPPEAPPTKRSRAQVAKEQLEAAKNTPSAA